MLVWPPSINVDLYCLYFPIVFVFDTRQPLVIETQIDRKVESHEAKWYRQIWQNLCFTTEILTEIADLSIPEVLLKLMHYCIDANIILS